MWVGTGLVDRISIVELTYLENPPLRIRATTRSQRAIALFLHSEGGHEYRVDYVNHAVVGQDIGFEHLGIIDFDSTLAVLNSTEGPILLLQVYTTSNHNGRH